VTLPEVAAADTVCLCLPRSLIGTASLNWQLAGHALQIRIRRVSLHPFQNPTQCVGGCDAVIGETADHEKWNRERPARWSVAGQRRDSRPIDAFAHRFRARFDFVSGGSEPTSVRKRVAGASHPIRLVANRALDVACSYALRRKFQGAILQGLGWEVM